MTSTQTAFQSSAVHPFGNARFAPLSGCASFATQLGGLSSILLIWFGANIRALFRGTGGELGQLGAITFGGFVIAAIGNSALFGFALAAATTAGQVPPEVTHTMSALSELFVVVFSLGMLAAMLAIALGAHRSSALPGWLTAASVVAAVPILAPVGFVGLIPAMFWVSVVSALLYRHQRRLPAQTAEVAQ